MTPAPISPVPRTRIVPTPTLAVAREEHGPEDGEPIVLRHGFPYDPRCFDWSGRAACMVAALWPERVRRLVDGRAMRIAGRVGASTMARAAAAVAARRERPRPFGISAMPHTRPH